MAAAAPSTSRLLYHHHHHHPTGSRLQQQQQRLRYSPNPSPLALRRRLSPAGALLPDRVTPFSYGVDDESDDHPREECGLVGVVGDPDAASLCYLGLQKLQHRGEEGAGIVSVGGDGKLNSVTGLGLVADVFGDPDRLASLAGPAAIGHVRYSTAGAVASLRNVQPFLAGYRFGQVAVAHNGNLVNYQALRSKLEARGSIFNTTSDTEVVLHLISTSLARPLLARICDACERLAGAYSLLFLTADKMFAVRDPHGFRPLVLGRRRDGAVVFASETCALDLIDATYEREVEPGRWAWSTAATCRCPRPASSRASPAGPASSSTSTSPSPTRSSSRTTSTSAAPPSAARSRRSPPRRGPTWSSRCRTPASTPRSGSRASRGWSSSRG